MRENRIRNLRLRDAISRSSRKHLNFMGEDLLLFSDFKNVPIPHHTFKMDCMCAVICYSGSARFALNTIYYSIQKDDLIIINVNEALESYEVSDDFNGIIIFISRNFIEDVIMNYEDISSLFLFSREHPILHLQEDDAVMFRNYYNMLELKISENDNHFRRDILRAVMLSWIYDLSNILYRNQQKTENTKRRKDVIFARFLKLVEENFHEQKRVTWYSEQLCISPKYLSSVIKSASMRSPNEWIDYYIILEARVLLRNTNKSIKEISDELNFPNQSFFGKFFKERVGVSPNKFRHGL